MSNRRYGSSFAEKAMMVLEARFRSGSLFISDTAAHAGKFSAIQATAAAVANITSPAPDPTETNAAGQMQGTLTAVPIPAGCTIYGNFTSITLASGSVIAYFAP